MPVRVGINGFGRIGRNVFRAGQAAKADIEWVAVNDITDNATLAHLLRYDSAYGRFPGHRRGNRRRHRGRRHAASGLRRARPGRDAVGGPRRRRRARVHRLFTDRDDAAKHLEAGAKKVVISAPAKGEDITVALGVNFDELRRRRHDVISNASCTTNCLAPVAKVLHETVGIKHGLMTTSTPTPATSTCTTAAQGPAPRPRRGR